MSKDLIWSGGSRRVEQSEGLVTSVGLGVGDPRPRPAPPPPRQRRGVLEGEGEEGVAVDVGRIEEPKDQQGTRPGGRIPMRRT